MEMTVRYKTTKQVNACNKIHLQYNDALSFGNDESSLSLKVYSKGMRIIHRSIQVRIKKSKDHNILHFLFHSSNLSQAKEDVFEVVIGKEVKGKVI